MDTSREAKAVNKFPVQHVSKHPPAAQFEINKLEIAEGLKQMLLHKGCDLNFLLHVEPESLAQQLGIDEDVAKLIIKAAKETNPKKYRLRFCVGKRISFRTRFSAT